MPARASRANLILCNKDRDKPHQGLLHFGLVRWRRMALAQARQARPSARQDVGWGKWGNSKPILRAVGFANGETDGVIQLAAYR